MVYAALMLAFGGLLLGMRMAGFPQRIGAVLGGARRTVAVMRSLELREAEKEAHVQRAALDMFAAFFAIVAHSLAALAGPAVFLLLCIAAGLFGMEEIAAAAGNGYFLIISTLAMLAAWRLSA
ncbi:MAG TPA: hypothetical protein VIR60_05595 [Gammaproteobacteria bacterium]